MRPINGSRQTGMPGCAIPLFDPESQERKWIPLTELEDMEKQPYDVLIVGTGAGGGAVLSRLVSRLKGKGLRIGMLERGGLLLPTHAQNIATMTPHKVFAYYGSIAHYIDGYISGQIYAVGGRTLLWSTTSPRMAAHELLQWPVPLQEMQMYYGQAEKALGVTGRFSQDAALTQTLLGRLQRAGIQDAIEEPLAYNLSPPNRFGIMNSNPVFSSILFLAQALNGSYDLAIHARVVQVLIHRGRCSGVEVVTPDKKRHIIRAKHVVMSASTFGTPHILLNSDIHLDALGRYMTNHSRVLGIGRIDREQFPENFGPLRILVPGNERRPYQIQVVGPGNYAWMQYAEQPLQRYWTCDLATLGEVEARYDNYVALDPTRLDEDGVPELIIRFKYSARDEEVFDEMAAGVKQTAAAMRLELIPDQNSEVCRMHLGSDIHEMGTCRMGDDPQISVTNSFGQVHGIEGLYIADNSVIPTSGTANPTLTTVALAFRTADALADRLV